MKKFVYGNTPAMLKQEINEDPASYAAQDAVFMGIPWEGGVTWNAYAGTELMPKAIRNASARYTGYLPELGDINIWDNLKVTDGGDLGCEPSDTQKTFDKITQKVCLGHSAHFSWWRSQYHLPDYAWPGSGEEGQSWHYSYGCAL